MLQIIIWLGCAFLLFNGWAVKLWLDHHYPTSKSSGDGIDKMSRGSKYFASTVVVALIFLGLSIVQASEYPDMGGY